MESSRYLQYSTLLCVVNTSTRAPEDALAWTEAMYTFKTRRDLEFGFCTREIWKYKPLEKDSDQIFIYILSVYRSKHYYEIGSKYVYEPKPTYLPSAMSVL